MSLPHCLQRIVYLAEGGSTKVTVSFQSTYCRRSAFSELGVVLKVTKSCFLLQCRNCCRSLWKWKRIPELRALTEPDVTS